MSPITTHVLDTAEGRPADGVNVVLERSIGPDEWQTIGSGNTDSEGRLRTLMPSEAALEPGIYRLTFHTAQYFQARGASTFYPRVIVLFETSQGEAHYHVPLLVSPFGFTSYRGT